jgi:hypothetical protein
VRPRTFAAIVLFLLSLATAFAQRGVPKGIGYQGGIQISPTSCSFLPGATNDSFVSPPLSASVWTNAPYFTVWAWAGAIMCGSKEIAPNCFTLVPGAPLSLPKGDSFVGGSVPLATPVQIGSGVIVPPWLKLGQFTLAANIPLTTPADTYKGYIYFAIAQTGNNAQTQALMIVAFPITISVSSWVTLTVGPAMNFTAVTTGNQFSQTGTSGASQCTQVVISSNADGVLSVAMGQLLGPAGSIFPTSQMCLGYGSSISTALSRATNGALGQASVSNIGYSVGTTTYYFVGRLNTLPANVAGSYTGALTAQATIE